MSAWESIDAFLEGLGIRIGAATPGQTTGGSHVPNSEHYAGRARDYGASSSDVSAITAALLPYAQGPGAPVDELFSSRDGVFYKNGQRITPSSSLYADHLDHVHVGLRAGVQLGTPAPAAAVPAVQTVGVGGGLTGQTVGVGGGLTGTVLKLALTGLFVLTGVGLVGLGATRAVGWKGMTP